MIRKDVLTGSKNPVFLGVVLSGTMILLATSAISAEEEKHFEMEKLTISDDPVINMGWQTFHTKCAVCHGTEGKGDGPMKEALTKAPADLTQIVKRNGGDFPYDKVYEIIDGTEMFPAHGSREMPIWGLEFAEEASGTDAGELAKSRINALITYLKSIQE